MADASAQHHGLVALQAKMNASSRAQQLQALSPAPVQRELAVTGEQGGRPLAGGDIRGSQGFNTAVARYGAARTRIANQLESFGADNSGRDVFPSWAAAIDNAAMHVLQDAVKRRDVTLFDLLLPLVRSLTTWDDSDEKTDLLTFTKCLLMAAPDDQVLRTMCTKIGRRVSTLPAALVVVANPLAGADQLPQAPELSDGITKIRIEDARNCLRMMIVLIKNCNRMITGGQDAEATNAVIGDIDDYIDRVMGYDSATNSPIPEALVLALQTLRDRLTGLRGRLNIASATATNVVRAGAGARPDRHASYDDLGNLADLVPAGPARVAYNRQITQGLQDGDQNINKTREEAFSAAAAATAYPQIFGQMTAAPRIEGINGNVEYYDTNGDPWDQKTAFRGSGVTATTAMTKVVVAIQGQQLVQYPRRGSAARVQVGVLLDSTYVNPREYEILWSLIFRAARAGKINLTKLKEVRSGAIMGTLPSLQLDPTDFDAGDEHTNVARLDQRANGTAQVTGRDGVIRGFQTVPRDALLARDDAQGSIAGAFAGTRDAYDVYSNGNGLLPGPVRYLEYSVPSKFLRDTSNKARIIRGSNGSLYITGTHYEAWTNTGTNTQQLPFYQIV
jgi:hypothetical protein